MSSATPPLQLADEPTFLLGGLTVSPATREISWGASSTTLEPRVMQVLVILARHRGQVVSRAQHVSECWGGRIVGEDAINRCIQALRRIASERGGFDIVTISRVGSCDPRRDMSPCSNATA